MLKVKVNDIQESESEPGVLAYVSYNNETEPVLNFNVRNNAILDKKFVKFVKANYSELLIIYKIQGPFYLHQHKIQSWQKWLLKNITSNWKKSSIGSTYYSDDNDNEFGNHEEGSLRLSNIWNEVSLGKVYGKTNDSRFMNGWAVGVYHQGVYQIIQKFFDDKFPG